MTRLSIIIILSFLFSSAYAGGLKESYRIFFIDICKKKFLSGDPRLTKFYNIDSLCKCQALGIVNSLSVDEIKELDKYGLARLGPRSQGTLKNIIDNCGKKNRK